jgi:type IV secretory pathway VirB4 component
MVCESLTVLGYPRTVHPGWLEPLITAPGHTDITLHIEPVPAKIAADRLRRQRARLESSRQVAGDRGRLSDPGLDTSAADAEDLAGRLARGDGRLFRVGLTLTCWAANPAALDRHVEAVRALCSALLLDARPVPFRALEGWLTTLPLGVDRLGGGRTMDTAALAAGFPFASADLPPPDPARPGVLIGANAGSSGLVFHDRFAAANHNTVVLARSGAGKSYLAKLEALRQLYAGVQVLVIDPEDEYGRLTAAVGGTHLPLGIGGVRLNPFDLHPTHDDTSSSGSSASDGGGGGGWAKVTSRALFSRTLLEVLLSEPLSGREASCWDRAVLAAYQLAGVTADPVTHLRPAPLLGDVRAQLLADRDPTAGELAGRLEPFTAGSYAGLFDGPTTVAPAGHLITFSLAGLPEEMKPAGTLLVLDAIWAQVADPQRRRPRIVVVDEAWLLMAQPAGARFLYRLAKSARKYWCGLTVITQDAPDLLGSELGQAVVANAATVVLLGQAPAALPLLAGAFDLTDGEAAFLAGAAPGEGILATGTERVAFRAVASLAEHRLVTTDPAELADRAAQPAGTVGGGR